MSSWSSARRPGRLSASQIRCRAVEYLPRSPGSYHSEHWTERMTATDEATRAAWCRHVHGDPHRADEVKRADKGMSDLIDRTWKSGQDDLTRDERRLMRKYRATIAADHEATLAAYRTCAKCNGSPLDTSEGATS